MSNIRNGASHDEAQTQAQQNGTQSHSASWRNFSGWRCFSGAALALAALLAVNLAGCGGGGGGGGNDGGGGATVIIQARNATTGALLPEAAPTAVATIVNPVPTATPAPVSVRLTRGSFTRTVTFTDSRQGAVFPGIPAGTYQVFVNGVRSTPDVVVLSTGAGGAEQTFQVIRGGTASSGGFLSKVQVTGRALLFLGTPPPPTNGSCSPSSLVTFPILVRVRDINQSNRPIVFFKAVTPNAEDGTFTITNIPLPGNGSQNGTFILEVLNDPSLVGNEFQGFTSAFTIGRRVSDDGDTTVSLGDICSTLRSGSTGGRPTPTPTTPRLPV